MAFKDFFKEFQSLTINDDYNLRQVNPDNDLNAYYEIYSDSDVMKYYEGGTTTNDKDKIKIILNNQIKAFEKAREYIWTIADVKANCAVGRIHLSNFESNNRVANIGYFIGRKHWGKGIASMSIAPVIQFGFNKLKLERIYTTVAIENIASWKALERNGFLREGLLRHSFNVPAGLCDCYIYSRLYTD